MNKFVIKARVQPKEDPSEKFNFFFESIVQTINSFNLTENNVDKLYQLLDEFSQQQLSLALALLPDELNNLDCRNALKKSNDIVSSALVKVNTKYKRQRWYETKSQFVAPKEMAAGLRWKLELDPKLALPLHPQSQSSFQYISIIDTLKMLYLDEKFKDLYFDHNRNHTCIPGVFNNFCCADVFQKSNFFAKYSNAMQYNCS